jgi:hypothetical protein
MECSTDFQQALHEAGVGVQSAIMVRNIPGCLQQNHLLPKWDILSGDVYTPTKNFPLGE